MCLLSLVNAVEFCHWVSTLHTTATASSIGGALHSDPYACDVTGHCRGMKCHKIIQVHVAGDNITLFIKFRSI